MVSINMKYPPKLNLARLSTPLHPLDRLSEALNGPRIWIKRDDMTGFATGGNKIRKLEYLLADMRAQGCNSLITIGACQSNHCRAAAVLGARLGFKTHLLLLGDLKKVQENNVPDGNLFINRLVDAEVTYYDLDENLNRLDQILTEKEESLIREGRKPYLCVAGGSSALGLWGYIAASEELKADFKKAQISPRYIIHATGSGGTQAGLTIGTHLNNLDAAVCGIAVWNEKAYFETTVREEMRAWQQEYGPDVDIDSLTLNTLDDYVGPGYGQAGPEVYEIIKQVARLEGVLLDPVYTGKAFHGMLEEIRKGSFADARDIVFIHTGGAIGLFAHRESVQLDEA
jgi:D-cysteine desulfhydrase